MLFQCGNETEAREQMRELNGLGLMHGMLRNGLKGDTDMLIAATEAIWKAIKDNCENVSWSVILIFQCLHYQGPSI